MKAFLSSTYEDLLHHRKAATEALERLGQQVGRMEVFGARPAEPITACLDEIQGADFFIGIYGHRYGFIPKEAKVSITEAELLKALDCHKPVFCFIVDDDYPWPPKMMDTDCNRSRPVKWCMKPIASSLGDRCYAASGRAGAAPMASRLALSSARDSRLM